MSSNIISCASIFPLIYSFVFLSNLEILADRLNLLKATGYVMYHQFNIQQLYALPTLYLCVLYLSENKHLQHKLVGFYNRNEKCLQRSTDWVFNP
jgi:hypothetical protein